mmetsp:Transcript_87682/g.151947  ORF Transcript_87682/g.151947 Transcript_87682/m.151947 type:complete len:291 (-) Transcript_87682:97-969(-)
MAPRVPEYAAKFKTIKMEIDDRGICVATLVGNDKGGVNLLNGRLFKEFGIMIRGVDADDSVRVLIVRSANEDFWMAHLDVNSILNDPDINSGRMGVLNEWHNMGEILRNMPKATIAEVAGRVGGGGHEFCLNFDMRFGVYGKTKICQMEAALGIMPGGGCPVNMHRYIGVGRTMEMVLTSCDIDAETAEKWGLMNRCFPDAASCRAHVDAVAARVASFSVEAVRCGKAAVLAAERMPHTEALKENLALFYRSARTPEATRLMQEFLKMGGQTREVELNIQDSINRLSSKL